jgi:probable rRNA maturation factor
MDITVKNLQSKIPIPVSRIKTTAEKAVRQLKQTEAIAMLSIVFVGPQRMRTINRTYLGHDYVTDVITFNLEEAGEIIVCPEVAQKNAKRYKNSTSQELLLYVIHGILHLSGYDDHKPSDIQKIRFMEQELLKKVL